MGEEVGNFVPTVFRETAKIRRLWPGALSTELKKTLVNANGQIQA